MTLAEMHVKSSVTLTDLFGPEILIILEMNGHVLHHMLLHLMVPGWVSDLDRLLIRK